MPPHNPFPARPSPRPQTQPQQERGQAGWPGQQPIAAKPADASAQLQWPQHQAFGHEPAPQNPDPYAPQFEPYQPQFGGYGQSQPQQPRQNQPAPGGYGAAPQAPVYQQQPAGYAPGAQQGYPSQQAADYGYAQQPAWPQHQAQPQARHMQHQPQPQAIQNPNGQNPNGQSPNGQSPHGFDVGSFGYGAPATGQGPNVSDFGYGHDHGAHDPGTHGHGVRTHGAHAHGAQDHGAHDHGMQDHGAQDWQPELSGGYGQAHDGYPAQDGYAQQNGHEFGAGEFGPAQGTGNEYEEGYEEEDVAYEEEAPRRGPRLVMMTAALAGAVLVGGGMAYSYRAIFGGTSGVPPVIKSASEPTKSKPADAGGKQFEYADRKIMGRLGDGSASADASPSQVDETGTRKVATLVVGRDGTIQAPPSASAPAPGTVPGTAVAVPGMSVVDAFGEAGRHALAQQSAEPNSPTVGALKSKAVAAAPAELGGPVQVKTVNAAAPDLPSNPTGSVAPASGEPEAEAAAEAPPKAVAKPTKVASVDANDAYSPSGASASSPAPVATTGSGYVAVLASIPRSSTSRIEALKRFADLQQKYGSVLSGKTPDVAEANLGAKGNYHRLLVGPPASRQKASGVCSQLKTEGYPDCWVMSY